MMRSYLFFVGHLRGRDGAHNAQPEPETETKEKKRVFYKKYVYV